MMNYEIPARTGAVSGPYEVLCPLPLYAASSPTQFRLAASPHGFSVLIEAVYLVFPFFKERPPKGRVFEDDCLEFFIRPQSSKDSFFPAPFYYCWEINAGGSLLEYRAGIGEEGRRIIGSGGGEAICDGSGALPGIEPVHGILRDTVAGSLISFEYDWKSKAAYTVKIDEPNKLWLLDLFIPWADFGLDEAPHGEVWYFTVNRIEVPSQEMGGKANGKAEGKPGLACLHEGMTEPLFHQPNLFPPINIR